MVYHGDTNKGNMNICNVNTHTDHSHMQMILILNQQHHDDYQQKYVI